MGLTPVLRTTGFLLFLVPLVGSAGCSGFGRWVGPRWYTDFDSAEAAVRESSDPLLIRYVDPKPGRRDPLDGAFDDSEVRQRLRHLVCCRLYKQYEPDRRYVGQFGVQRAPAVILVHPDDTFRAQTGRINAEELLAFLDPSAGTDQTVSRSPYIRREARFDWQGGISAVAEAVEHTGKPGLVLVYRRFSSDLDTLDEMLETHEVYSRIGHMVHGREPGWNRWARTRKTQFGEIKLPAIVLMQPGGQHDVFEMPNSSAAIARFADRCLSPRRKEATQSATVSNTIASP